MEVNVDDRNIVGILLKMERLRQGKSQKEVCFNICVPSYLSKIEHGAACADTKLLAMLFLRLGIVYETDDTVLAEWEKQIKSWFYCLHYNLERKPLYEKLKTNEAKLSCSIYAVDWLLIRAFEEDETAMDLLAGLESHMNVVQQAYLKLLCCYYGRTKEQSESVRFCREASDVLNNSFAFGWLCQMFFVTGDYFSIHEMEQRMTAAAIEEGNTYALADYYLLNGSAYACVNMERMMMVNYERGMRLLQNTGWQKELASCYYNIGATYISLKKYDLALEYLEKAEWEESNRISILHKKAVACIRIGKKDTAKMFLSKMRDLLDQTGNALEADLLKYEEAVMECEEGFLDDPKYLELLERLIKAIERELHFGHLYFYRDVMISACKRQRKYKTALEFEEKISSHIKI